jgi:hypothetical protein
VLHSQVSCLPSRCGQDSLNNHGARSLLRHGGKRSIDLLRTPNVHDVDLDPGSLGSNLSLVYERLRERIGCIDQQANAR